MMDISKDNFFAASSKLEIPQEKAEALWSSLEKHSTAHRAFSFSKLIFYFGALIILAGMTWFMQLGWEWFGGGGIFFISISYAIILTLIGALLWNREGLRIPSGLLITVAVCMIPMAIYGLETYFNIWPQGYPGKYQDFYQSIKGSWVFMEVGTILAGFIALRFFPFPFLTAPIFGAAWFLTMDLIPILLGKESTWEQKNWLSVGFGLVLICIAFLIDRKLQKKQDYGFWGYLFGTISFWFGLTALSLDKGEAFFFIYFVINLLMIIASILLQRKIFIVFGAIGVFIYFGHLADVVFKDSIAFPFVISFIGLAVMYLGILYQKHAEWIEKRIIEKIPLSIRQYLPSEKD